LLPATETGQVVLIGATTRTRTSSQCGADEPFHVVAPVPLSADDLEVLVRRGVELRQSAIADEAIEAITSASDGDARVALTTLDTAIVLAPRR